MVKLLILSIKNVIKSKKRSNLLLYLLLYIFIPSINTQAQDLLFGFTGGLNMTTISSKYDESGFKVGLNLGGIAQYRFSEEISIITNLKFASKGQQFSIVKENTNEYTKTYHSTTLYYIDIPIMLQYQIKDIVGFEAGTTFGLCLGGRDKSQIGNEPWQIQKFSSGTYNPFEFGLTCGVFSRDLGQNAFNNIYIELRYFIGLTNFIKNYHHNYNNGVLINIGYIIEKPLKHKQ